MIVAKLEKLLIPFDKIELGYADIPNDIDTDILSKLNAELKAEGLEILDNHNAIVIEKIKKYHY